MTRPFPSDTADAATLVRHVPRNRRDAPSKLRRGGRHCPICLAAFAKNAKRTRRVRCCDACGAHPQPGKACASCGADAIWQAHGQAACQRCAAHGEAHVVIADATPVAVRETTDDPHEAVLG
ncbi:hypothetical protein GCM10023307_16590 [Lysobacter hankyongensis]|uniref:Uncharacterized protein n=1 Tax=Lysobacter hankyongensis TaxID=1176535 RepID=A0ABP9B8D4_9GAMM